MKFLSVALASLAAMVAVDAKHLTNDMIQERLRTGNYNKEKLMSKAIPYNPAKHGDHEAVQIDNTPSRKLDENNYMANYSIKFNTCVDLKVKNVEQLQEEMNEQQEQQENGNYNGGYQNQNSLTSMLKSGDVVSQKSYVIFNICQSSECYYSEDSSRNTYIVDIGTFVGAMSQYLPATQDQFCEQCEKNEDYCYGNYGNNRFLEDNNAGYYAYNGGNNNNNNNGQNQNDNGQNQNWDGQNQNQNWNGQGQNQNQAQNYNQNQNQNGNWNQNWNQNWNGNWNGNNNNNNGYSNAKYIDCQKCFKKGCLAQNNYNGNNGNNEGNNMYEQAAEWLNELAECGGGGGENNYASYYKNYAVTPGLTCNYDGTGIEFGGFLDEDCTFKAKGYSPSVNGYYYSAAIEILKSMSYDTIPCAMDNTQYTNPYDNNYDGDNNNGNVEMGEWCEALYDGGDGDGEVQNLASCANNYNNNNNNGENNQENNEQDYYYDWSWWQYDIDAEYAEGNNGYVCSVVSQMHNSAGWSKGSSGVYYVNQKTGVDSIFHSKQHHSMKAWAEMIGYTVLGLIILFGAYAGVTRCCAKKSKDALLADETGGEPVRIDPMTGYRMA